MSVSTIIFSRDRAAQLDLCLRSLEIHAEDTLDPVLVLYRGTDADYESAYAICETAHPEVEFLVEDDFEADTRGLIAAATARGEHLTFVMDDDVVYLPVDDLEPAPGELLDGEPDLLCVSLRLGLNTTRCYPHDREQGVPRFDVTEEDALSWVWRTGDADFGYPGSLDAHVFRTADFQALISGRPFTNPNTLEDALVAGCVHSLGSRMACYSRSSVVGIPANRVSATHLRNRYGSAHFEPERLLNAAYLRGERLDPSAIRASKVDAAHCEFEFTWLPA